MIELGKAERQIIEQICQDSNEVLILGAMEGTMGRVWVAKTIRPSYCLILVGDFSYLIGIPPKGKAAMELKIKICEECHHTFITATDDRWKHWLEDQFVGEYRKIARYALKKEKEQFNLERLEQLKADIPKGFQLKQMDDTLYQLALKEEWSKDFCANFEDAAHFKRAGLGFVILKGRKIVAGCSAYGSSDHKMEIEVITRKEYRRKGLALACSAAFVLECLKGGVIPNWDAANLASVALAEKLGYLFDYEYEVYQLILSKEKQDG